MEQHLDTRTYPAGEVIFDEGDPGHEVFIIKSGLVEIAQTDLNGTRQTLAFLGEGNLFGEMALVDQEPRSASAKALENTDCYVLPEPLFRENMDKTPPLIQSMVQLLVQRLRLTTREASSQRL
ncbi:Crp/Fnr family transcriptional regulator [Magnetospira sp. QH-2]|uniref:Crp/Fnr family transcriptional regulator n=1 Tax=Magnetospira sp. (strain QH-2) TaxID=1288970 RepID=UPI0003E81B6E|nr:cyclic nucleotide-binding domain-containing protein [Magnetospira sp. QH-2]CCQ73933.1 Conserved protein of unknown function. Containing cyclic nucleotide-binding-like domain [Magnetospira sp. QH-2]